MRNDPDLIGSLLGTMFRGTQLADGLNSAAQGVADRLGATLRQTFQAGDRLQRGVFDAMFRVWPTQAQAPGQAAPEPSAREAAPARTIISYTQGHGRFSADKRFITLDNVIYTAANRENGYHQGVWERHFNAPEELLAIPPNPAPPLDQPVGPVPAVPIAASTKALWSFRDGAIYSVGPAASHLVPLADGSFLFLVSTAQIITNGTGAYTGAYGMTQSLGATHVPAGVNLFEGEPKPFPAATIDTFTYNIPRTRPTITVPAGVSMPSRRPSRPTFQWADGIQSATVDVCGSRIHYLEGGRGEPILFVHGNPVWSYVWRNVLPYTLPSGRCLAPDLIGMGLSDHPDLEYGFFTAARYFEAFVDRLKLKNLTLVLHDWGTAVGFFYAMRHPSNVRRLVFMEALLKPYATWNDFPAALRPTFQTFRTPNTGFEKIVVDNVFIEELLPRSMFRKLSEDEMNAYRFPFRNPPARKLVWALANDLPIAGSPRAVNDAVAAYGRWLRNTSIPKLLVHGIPGAITSKTEVDWARRNLRNIAVTPVGRGLHFLQEDCPAEVGRAIANWCARTR